MGRVLLPPTRIEDADYMDHLLFLAGSIEMDKAVNWQSKVANELLKFPSLTIFNPRRGNWDSSWVQSIGNLKFNEQVTWELDYIEMADTVIFYFDPKTKSPITLMELGIVSQRTWHPKKVIVCCPEGFWRKGNVDILCSRMENVIQVSNLEELINVTKEYLSIRLRNEK